MNDRLDSLTVGLVAIVNILWYTIKWILATKEYPVHLFWGHFGDIRNFRNLIAKETAESAKPQAYRVLLVSLYVSITAMVIVVAIELLS